MSQQPSLDQEKEVHLLFMRAALQEAQKAAESNEVPVGAVVVAGGKIIARGHNQVEQLKDPTAHAELLAITAATHYLGGKYLHHCTLYVTLEPCAMCGGALYWAQLHQLVFGADDPKKGYRSFPSLLHPKTKVIEHLLVEESQNLLIHFFKQRRKVIP